MNDAGFLPLQEALHSGQQKRPPPVTLCSTDVYQEGLNKKTKPGEHTFYAKTPLYLNNTWQALPSLQPNEIVTHLHIEPQKEVEIQYSLRDNLYYIKGKENVATTVSVDFLVETAPACPQRLTGDLLKLLEYCQGFGETALTLVNTTDLAGTDYLQALAHQRVGACRHRTVVLKALLENEKLRKSIPALKDLQTPTTKVRIIENACHSYVEIFDEDSWVSYNLGGYPGTLHIHETANPLDNKNLDNKTPVNKRVNENPGNDLSGQTPLMPRQYFSTPAVPNVPTPKAYVQSIVQKEEPKRLIECTRDQLPGLLYQLQEYCKNTSKHYRYIHSADELILRRPYVELQNNRSGILKSGLNGPVYQFLSDNPSSSRTLIVNFANFSTHDLVRFNTLLDEEPHIDGVALPKGTKVIALIESAHYKDASLYSRFAGAVESCPLMANQLTVPSPFLTTDVQTYKKDEILEIDLNRPSNWQALLLGSWKLNKDNLYFIEGELIKRLSQSRPIKKVVLKNPPMHDADFSRFFQEASLRGYIEHHGKQYPWPNPTIEIKNDLVFSSSQIQSIKYRPPKKAMLLINPGVYSRFFNQYRVEKNGLEYAQLIENNGLLSNYTNKIIYIYVSEDMSDRQWSLLLAECKRLSVQLKIILAPNVSYPPQLSNNVTAEMAKSTAMLDFSVKTRPLTDCCVYSTDFDLTMARWPKRPHEVICIDTTELNSSDLLLKITGQFNEQRMALDFSQKEGALQVALSQGKTVILHGECPQQLRQRLQDFLFMRGKQNNPVGQVVIVTDEKTAETFAQIVPVLKHNVTAKEKQDALEHDHKTTNGLKDIDARLPYVTQQAILRYALAQASQEASQEKPWTGLKTALPPYMAASHIDLFNAEEQTRLFNESRLNAVKNLLTHSPFVFLAGMTGVGKTSFIEKIWKTESKHLYIGEHHLHEWAKNQNPGLKTLFIDEANITQKQWSQFEGLFHNDPPGMMIDNKYVTLTLEHKVIFAGNPTTYSDDRTLPRLFERHGNSVVFEPMPPAYIYQEMLSPLFNEENRALAHTICSPILALNQFMSQLTENAVLITPRELVMMTQLSIYYSAKYPDIDPAHFAKYFAYQLSRQFVPSGSLVEFDKKFQSKRPVDSPIPLRKNSLLCITESNQPSAQVLTDFLSLRQFLIEKNSNRPAGLGGIILEGSPGLGKSELAIACLLGHGMEKRSIETNNTTPDQQNYFYHLPAGANEKTKRYILNKAFHEGAIVLYDEINASASMERLLNQLLMGKGPSGESPRKPGFMLVGTQNPSTMPGRSTTTIAMLHRMHKHEIPHYSNDEMHQILRGMGLPGQNRQAIIQQYKAATEVDKALCFRDVILRAKEDLRALFEKANNPMSKEALLKIASESNDSNMLEAVFLHELCDKEIQQALIENLAFQLISDWIKTLDHTDDDAKKAMLIIEKRFAQTTDDDLLFLIKHFKNNNDFFDKTIRQLKTANGNSHRGLPLRIVQTADLQEHHLKKMIEHFKNDDHFFDTTIRQLKSDTRKSHLDLLINIVKIPQLQDNHLKKIIEAFSEKDVLRNVVEHPNLKESMVFCINKLLSLNTEDESTYQSLFSKIPDITLIPTKEITSNRYILSTLMTREDKNKKINALLQKLNVALIQENAPNIAIAFNELCTIACTKRNRASSFFLGKYSTSTHSATHLLELFEKNERLLNALNIDKNDNNFCIKLRQKMLEACATPSITTTASVSPQNR